MKLPLRDTILSEKTLFLLNKNGETNLKPNNNNLKNIRISFIYNFKNSLIILEENTKKNLKRVVSLYVIEISLDFHKLEL
jgi:hypothetical protein